jgi:MerR family transcriptional regulator, light-induced transcriptional regulator
MSGRTSSLSIGAVEQETGIGKDTLRVWEKRYGFPAPLRSDGGVRRYPQRQVRKLHIIRQLMDRGLRPGNLVPRTIAELTALQTTGQSAREDSPWAAELEQVMAALHSYAIDDLRSRLRLGLSRVGLRHFLSDFVEPLNIAVGEAWARGDLTIAQEHCYTEQIQGILRHAIESIPPGNPQPRILLTTLSGEEHQLGLLMAHASLTLEGAQCLSLGIQMPISQIQAAAKAYAVDVVGLSFGQANKEREARDGLLAVRDALPLRVQIWTGGRFWHQSLSDLPGITPISALTDIPAAVVAWRAHRSESRSTRI